MGHRPPPSRDYGPRPFTIDAVKWSYVHDRCTFEEMEHAVELLIRRESGEGVPIPSRLAHRAMRVPADAIDRIPVERTWQ